MKRILLSALLATAGVSAFSADLNFSLLRSLDLASLSADATSANYIGSNPSAIAWNGSDLYVAGFNASGVVNTVGIARVSDALNTAVIGTPFGAIAGAPNTRGYAGLAVSGSRLLATYDSGAAVANGLVGYDLDGTQAWAVSTRGITGPSFDPGFGGTAPAASLMTLSSGRRQRYAVADGAAINTSSNGAIVNFPDSKTTWRDHDYDPSTGDLYTREEGRVGKAVRSADNVFAGGTSAIFTPSGTLTNTIVGTNLAFVSQGGVKAIIFNNRTATGSGQAFSGVVQAIDPNGAAVGLNLSGFDAGTLGNGFYDFSFDAASGTLAVMDFQNRSVQIYGRSAPVPEPATMAVLGLGALGLLKRRRAR